MQSEVAWIREQIERRCEAMQRGLNAFAITSKHDFINKQMETIGLYQEQLQTLIGEQAAARIVCEAYSKALESDAQ